jgi:haloalkane dehalogenase
MQMPRRPVRDPGRLREIDRDVNDAIARHSAAGFRFEAGGVRAFARQQGEGADVVLLHGVPTSSFLYRKVLPVLSDQGLRGTAFDFPGMGLADRPAPFDYSWSGLARWTGDAIDALGLGRVHLVVHDIGGPIGFEWAIHNPDRVLSVTMLNTVLDVDGFKRPWPMAPFAVQGLGEAWLRLSPRLLFSEIFYSQGIAERSRVPRSQIYAHIALLRLHDRGRAFLEIMRGFELGPEKERFFREGLADRQYPVRAVWGERDPALGLDRLEAAKSILGLSDAILLPAKHFLQEDHPGEIAQAIADLAAPLG